MNPRLIAPSLLLATVAFSCTSILGDFKAGPGGPSEEGGTGDDGSPGSDGGGNRDGAGDARPSEGGSPTDGPAGDSPSFEGGADAPADSAGDGAIPLVTMTCTGTKLAQPLLVKSLDANAGGSAGDFNWGIAAFPTGATTTRFVAGRATPDIFSVYELDTTTSPPAVTALDVPIEAGITANSESIAWVGRLQAGFGVAVSFEDGSGFIDLDLYVFRDAASIATVPAPLRLYTTQNITDDITASILEVAPQEYFATAVVLNVSNGTNALLAGLSAGGAQANMGTVDSSTGNPFGDLVSVHAGSTVYVYVVGSTGPAFYALSDTGTSNGPRTSIPRAESATPITEDFLDAVPGSAPNTTNLAYLELDVNEAGTGLGGAFFSTAAVPQASLAGLTIADIAFGRTYTDLGSVPGLSSGGMGFYGDDFVAIGPGVDTQSNPTSWVNFLWLDMHGVVRGEQVGVNGILAGLGTELSQDGRTIVASPGPRSAQQAAWNVAWIEQDRDDAGLFYDSVFYQELDCTP